MARLLARWYVTASGGLFLVVLATVATLAIWVSHGAAVVALAMGIVVVVPYKLMRLEHGRLWLNSMLAESRQRVQRTVSRVSRRLDDVSRRLDNVSRRLDDMTQESRQARQLTDRRIHQHRVDLLGSIATTRDDMMAMLRAEREAWTQSIRDRVAEVDADTRNVEQALTGTLSELRTSVDANTRNVEQALTGMLGELRTSVHARLAAQNSEICLSLARRDGRVAPIGRVVLIVCPQRVGSTWMLDLLRHHLQVGVHPTADLYRDLGVAGRRYPAQLTDTDRDGIEIEVQIGVGGRIPRIGEPNPEADCSVEKVHPSAIAFDAASFVERVTDLRARLGGVDTVQPIYLVRNPVESMRSFVAIKRRVHTWHADVPEEQVHSFYRQSYETIAAIHRDLPGPVVSFEHLLRNPTQVIADLLIELGLEATFTDATRHAEHAVLTVQSPQPAENPFYSPGSDKPSVNEIALGVGTPDSAQAQKALDVCRAVCDELNQKASERALPFS